MPPLDLAALRRMNVPQRLWEVSFTGLPSELQKPFGNYTRKLDSMLRNGVGFYLHGPSGTGKTSAGVVLLKVAYERGRTGYYTCIKELRQAIREELAFEGDASMLTRCKEVDLLVLDDLALDDFKNFTFGVGEIEHMLTNRTQNGKTTVLSTRLTPDILRTESPSLLQTMQGNFLSVACVGPNLKEQAAERLRKELGV